MVRKIGICIVALCFILMSACGSGQSGELIELIDIDQLHKVVSGSKVEYIYFGRPTCPDCNNFVPYLEDVLETTTKDVYYFNTDDRKDDDGFDDIIEVFDVVWVPALYKVQENAIIDAFPLKFEREPNQDEVSECINELNKFFGNNI